MDFGMKDIPIQPQDAIVLLKNHNLIKNAFTAGYFLKRY